MIRRRIAALTQGSYLLETPPNPLGLLVGFHGYGEDSQAHLDALKQIPASRAWLLCSVQSLHLFYNSKTRQVIGSWMTRQDRDAAIENNIRYVRSVVRSVQQEFEIETPLVFAGFSQGVAMAYRAAACSGLPCDGLIALAGDVPPEIAANRQLCLPRILLGRGREDPWYSEEKMAEDLRQLQGRSEVTECRFPGGHVWSREFLAACDRFLKRIPTPERMTSS